MVCRAHASPPCQHCHPHWHQSSQTKLDMRNLSRKMEASGSHHLHPRDRARGLQASPSVKRGGAGRTGQEWAEETLRGSGRSQPTGCHRDPASTQWLRSEGPDRGNEIPSMCCKHLTKRPSFIIFTQGAALAPSPGQYILTHRPERCWANPALPGLRPAWGMLLGLAPEGRGGGSAVLPTVTDRPQGTHHGQGQGPRPGGTQDGGD